MAPTVRTAKKLLLGREIAHMIESAGVSQAEAAKLIETSQPRIASLISGGSSISPGDLVLLAQGLGFKDEGYLESLRDLRRDNHKRGFWSTGHNRVYAEDLRLLVDLEKHVDQMRSTEVEVVPGLLQTEAYARAMHADRPTADGVTIEDLVQARLSRQDILDRTEPPSVLFVLSESCLRRLWAPKDVMREQIEHLVALSNRPNVMIQVMPYDVPPGRRSAIGNRFTLLRVPSPGAAGPLELAYTEGEGEIRYLDDKKALSAYESAWARLTNAALRFDESRTFMKKVVREFTE
ncbi:Scr1 family TA system antitoxin-like transcriptional regulator [Amycolatopsis palatopharyngis]|uniref:Scr1 family TA system antitoxin-like transcriptional regulator n=1 Tax=Amycolatopsis palatopharyngis TaxID=187982 RepID=UPI000E247065|nr:Scr1 family TA system antitoxin-like transcriptional regulator [Amycolatopsis palatopharyngis]